MGVGGPEHRPPEDPLPSRPERGLDVSWHLVDGRPVRSLSTGAAGPEVPELVVVPGLGALGYLVPLARACAAWTRVHLLDLPGFGHPLTARLPADLDTLARVLTAWLATVPTGPVVLLGHSTGAQAAARAAHDRVSLLVLAGATFPPSARRPGPLVARVARTLPHEQPGQLPAVLPYYRRGRRRLPSLLASALLDAPEQAVTALTPPLLVLRGQDDHLCDQAWAATLAACAPRARVVTLPGAHNAPYTLPELTSRVLAVHARPSSGEGAGAARSRAAGGGAVLHLTNGTRLEGDEETVWSSVDDGQAGGDGVYAADVAEATGLPSERVTSALAALLDRGALATTVVDPELGPRYVRGTGL